MANRLTRRAFLGRAGSLAALAAVPSACGGKFSLTGTTPTATTSQGGLAVFRLATGCGPGGHCSCRACEKHAANKLFATQQSADLHRAHPHCNCGVVQEELVPDTWRALFGDPSDPTRTEVDRRDPQVQKILT